MKAVAFRLKPLGFNGVGGRVPGCQPALYKSNRHLCQQADARSTGALAENKAPASFPTSLNLNHAKHGLARLVDAPQVARRLFQEHNQAALQYQ